MRGLRLLAGLLALAGVALIGWGVARGDVRVGLFLVVPFAYGTGLLPFLGMLCLMAAAAAWLSSFAPRGAPREAWAQEEARAERRGGGVVLLGPIPIVWGSSPGVRKWMLVLGAAMLGLWLLVVLLTRG